MTIPQIQKVLKKRGKKLSRTGLYKHIRALKIEANGVGRPAIYPDNTADKIAGRIGLNGRRRK